MSDDARHRDYGLNGPDSARAVALGLADASWYHPPVAADRLQALMTRTNGRAARDTVLWLALLVAAGVAAWRALGSWWAVPAFAVYGALYGGASDARWHECGHGTAFRTRWVNDAIYPVASFMQLREPTLWRWSHVRHHSDTIIVGRDPEIAVPRPPRLWLIGLNAFNIVNGPKMLWRAARHAAGSVDVDAREIVPDEDLRKVVWEARAALAVLAAVIVWSVAIGSPVPLLFVGLPSFYGAWLMVFFGLTQHAGLREDVLDHRLNTRTVRMNPVLRFLYLNMNYHLEHHLFPAVPYHALPALHGEVAAHLPPPKPSTWAAYREILPALRAQHRDPSWEIADLGIPDEPAAAATATMARDATDLGPAVGLAPGRVARVDLGEATFALCRLSTDEVVLVDGWCTHGQAHLADGLVIDGTIECPKHNGRFDLRTGAAVRRPARLPLATYPVRCVDGRLVADLDPT